MTNPTEEIEALAAKIGEDIYIDVAKWHLPLDDAKLHTVLAQKLYPLLEKNELSEDAVLKILRDIRVPIGGGRIEIPLVDLLPTKCQVDLMDLLEAFQGTRD